MIKAGSVSARCPFVLPPDLYNDLPDRRMPWNISRALSQRIEAQPSSEPIKFCQVLSSDPEFQFIHHYFSKFKPCSYGIERIIYIHIPNGAHSFENLIEQMHKEEPKAKRARTAAPAETESSVLPLWHKRKNNFDGKFYFTHSAEVASRDSPDYLLLAWVFTGELRFVVHDNPKSRGENEFVILKKEHTLPRFWVELKVDCLSDSISAESSLIKNKI